MPIKIFGEKGAWAYPGAAQFFSATPYYLGNGLSYELKFCMYIYRLNRNKSPLKSLRKVAMNVVRDARKFSGHPYIGRIARSSLRQLSFLVTGVINLKSSKTNKNKFERNKVDEFVVEAVDIGELRKIKYVSRVY